MGYRHLVDFHLFSLTKRFSIALSAIYICINKTVPGFLDYNECILVKGPNFNMIIQRYNARIIDGLGF